MVQSGTRRASVDSNFLRCNYPFQPWVGVQGPHQSMTSVRCASSLFGSEQIAGHRKLKSSCMMLAFGPRACCARPVAKIAAGPMHSYASISRMCQCCLVSGPADKGVISGAPTAFSKHAIVCFPTMSLRFEPCNYKGPIRLSGVHDYWKCEVRDWNRENSN